MKRLKAVLFVVFCVTIGKLHSVETPQGNDGVMPDTRRFDELYKLALAEGGKLIVYAGGDSPDQQESNRIGFETDFPGIRVEMVVDFSKHHDARVDYQLKNNKLVVDVAQLQTLQNFPRWKKEGVLLMYKAIEWDHIYDEFKDPDGAFTGVFMDAFSTNVNTELLTNKSSWPVEANDYLKPEFKDKLAVTYPNDDDAVLFWFKQVVDKYGITYLERFLAQNPVFVRGTATALSMVADTEQGYVATMSADGGLNAQEKYGAAVPRFVLPEKDPFVLWAQTAAIFKKAPHPETAKLYISWLVDKKRQEQPTAWSWSVRDDVPPPPPFKSPLSYPNGDPNAFFEFMLDRQSAEIFRNQISLVFGEVIGINPNEPAGALGMYPVIGYRANLTAN
ncbi:hypothetical protein Bhyg_01427 [Pseudolycoriella hygida]|uniref:Uncharacterized protein n=1 Tax=Pseudolycoriella hygida TaxID=35572 RepID=A0A9Q0NB02_9DIPT|nr:hypothetical protein Bhyg_01427 [Pseudolycoriella hygida]